MDSLVIIPTFNEADNLASLVAGVLQEGPFHILVVDDNSPDGTGEVAESLAHSLPDKIFVIHRPRKLGLGSAYIRGFRFALQHGYQHVFEMDADFSHDPLQLPALRNALARADVVLGSRYVPGSSIEGWPLWRRLISRGGSLYAAIVLGLPFRDLTSGFKGFRRQVLEALDLDSIRSNGYSFQIEVTFRCYQHGFQILEVPIRFQDRRAGRSKMDWNIVLEAFVRVWQLRLGQPVLRGAHF